MRLDHFVVHIDQDPTKLQSLKDQIVPMGFPFNQNGITFKALFGLLKKSLPFRLVYIPPIPGTDLEIFFLEMDSQEKYEFMRKYFMKPNAEKNGITGIKEAVVRCQFSEEAWKYIRAIFPNLSGDHN